MGKVRIETTILNDEGEVVEQTHEIETRDFTCIVHEDNMGVEVPEFHEINSQDTMSCIDSMSQGQWNWVSGASLFRLLWKKMGLEGLESPPEKIDVLKRLGPGSRHLAGLITLSCEALMAGKNIFFRNPENHLHPKQQQKLMDMLITMKGMFGGSGGNETATADGEEGEEEEGFLSEYRREQRQKDLDEFKAMEEEMEERTDEDHCMTWIDSLEAHYGPDKEFAELEGKRYTIDQLRDEVDTKSKVGKQFVQLFVKMRGGKTEGE